MVLIQFALGIEINISLLFAFFSNHVPHFITLLGIRLSHFYYSNGVITRLSAIPKHQTKPGGWVGVNGVAENPAAKQK